MSVVSNGIFQPYPTENALLVAFAVGKKPIVLTGTFSKRHFLLLGKRDLAS